MKVVLDTNIFISGIFWKGKCNEIINLWRNDKFTLVTSLEIISELIDVLNDFKIKLTEDLIRDWRDLIIKNSNIVEIRGNINLIKEDPDDNMFIETALEGKADYIISQDNHLLNIKEYSGIKIINPEEFLDLFN